MGYPLTNQVIAAMALDLVQNGMTSEERARTAETYADTSNADKAELEALAMKIRKLSAECRTSAPGVPKSVAKQVIRNAAENRSASRDPRIPEEYADCPFSYDDARYPEWCSARTVLGIGRVYR